MGLLGGIARTAVVAGTASAVGGRVRHRQDQKWAQQDAQAAAPAPAYAAPAPVNEVPQQRSSAPAPDRLQQLKQLGDLKAQGVLTEAEFAAEKAKILAG
jgi:Short C-terminal domain